jgi:Domain of unknown function DUF29
MPNDLYDRDVLTWSEHQADLLRRLARGEQVNDVDWEHVVEEIEDVGLSELHAVAGYLEQILVHLLRPRHGRQATRSIAGGRRSSRSKAMPNGDLHPRWNAGSTSPSYTKGPSGR